MSKIKRIVENFLQVFCPHKPLELMRLDSMTTKVSCFRCKGLFIFHEKPKIYERWSQASETLCLNYAIAEKALKEIKKQAKEVEVIIPKQEDPLWRW